jgi:two-component system, NarL family, sensor histidine kinase UhpB
MKHEAAEALSTRGAGAAGALPAHGPPAAEAGPVLIYRTSLKLRLSLLITALLALVMLAAGLSVVHSAREDVRGEVLSTLNLATHLLDGQITALRDRAPQAGAATRPMFGLRDLSGVRHLNIQFLDNDNRLLESNATGSDRPQEAPRWFEKLVSGGTPAMTAATRLVTVNGQPVGRLVISPDPTAETEETWQTTSGLLVLLLVFFVLVNGLVWWAVARAMRPIEHILRALGQLQHGNLAARLPRFAEPDMERISVGFNHMAETLEMSLSENRRLTRRLLKAQEDERNHLARELHDEIGQCVSAIHADAVAIRNRGSEPVRESAEAIVEVAAQIKQMVRGMLYRLRPPLLEDVGLPGALRELVASFQQRNPEVSCSLRCSEELRQLNDATATAVYRVVQECLSNITLHANARNAMVEVLLQPTATESAPDAAPAISVTAADDGVGFAQPPPGRGFGLAGIRERVNALGGSCQIDSQPGAGTRVIVQIPLSPELEESA